MYVMNDIQQYTLNTRRPHSFLLQFRLYFVDVRGFVVDLTLIVLVNVRIDWDYCNGLILLNRLCTTLMPCER